MAGASLSLWTASLAALFRGRIADEWFAGPLGGLALGGPRATGFAAQPRAVRPTDPERGRELLAGVFNLGGESLTVPPGEDPWSRPSPSRRFAVRLHRFDWLGDLMATGEPGAREALRLALEWRRVFGRRWGRFAWGPETLERRVFNLACAGAAMAALASEAETQSLADSLARQARHLLRLGETPPRAADRCAAAALAGAVLAGEAGGKLMSAATQRLSGLLSEAVLADGGHASRSPQAGMELLFDLLILDDALIQRGQPPAPALSRAIDRLTGGLRFFTLSDGGLAAFQGGEASSPARIIAARAHDDASAQAAPLGEARHVGYQRLTGRSLDVFADARPPATGAWSTGALGQPLAIEVICNRERLIAGCGWSPAAAAAQNLTQALRLAAGGSTASVGAGAAGEPLSGLPARALGARLIHGAREVVAARRETQDGVWLDLAHDGWLDRYGLTHERRLYLDLANDELRGEDRFVPAASAKPQFTPIAIHFHLHPDVRASIARDQRSVLLKGRSNVGWWLRNDASEVVLEPSVHFVDGRPHRTTQVVLRGRLRADRGGRVRWKLGVAEGGQTAPAAID